MHICNKLDSVSDTQKSETIQGINYANSFKSSKLLIDQWANDLTPLALG